MTMPDRPLLACLVPVRNAAADLPGFFDSIRHFCDTIIALDDGSTDNSAELLENEPLVSILLRNPVRPDYTGWDDAANRNRLLAAAADLDPEWVISIDADERIDLPEARALRRFIETDALPGCAYGFRHVPMRSDANLFQPKYQWIYRLFSFETGQRFPNQRLHFIPVPVSIPRNRWVKTTLRIQHLGGITANRRLARYEKYLEADPARKYQARYSPLLDAPTGHHLRTWLPRPESMPVLLANASNPEVIPNDGNSDRTGCTLSVIVISRNDEAVIASAIQAILDQECPEPFEVILVTSGTDRTAEIVRSQFPGVKVIALTKPALPGEARNAGLRVAQGSYVTFPGSHVQLRPGSLAARLEAHRRGYAMVTGLVENGTQTPAGWASYFLDHSEGMPGQLSSPLNGPPAHCSYAVLALLEVGGFPEGVRTAEDTMINRELFRRGYLAYRDARVRFVHHSPCRTWRILLKHHFTRGRGSGRLAVIDHQETGKLLTRKFLVSRLLLQIPSRYRRIQRGVSHATADLQARHRQAWPGILLGITAHWLGMWWEILQPTPGKLSILVGRPYQTILVATTQPEFSAHLVRIDRLTGQATARSLSPTLQVDTGTTESRSLESLVASIGSPASDRRSSPGSPLENLHEFFDIEHLHVIAGTSRDVTSLLTDQATQSAPFGPLRNIWNVTRVFRYRRNGQLATTMGNLELALAIRDLSKFGTRESRK